MAATVRKLALSRLKTAFLSPNIKVSSFCRRYAVTGNPAADKTLSTLTGGRIEGWMKSYEDLVGLTEVNTAQNKVIQAETKFLTVQNERREKQLSMSQIQSKLKDLHIQLDKVQRGDERYLALLTEEYEVIKDEKELTSQLALYENQERDYFSALSSAVRESHEKERQRTERTKYWSIFGSIIGAIIGILGTSINNYLRMREIKGIVTDSAAGGLELKGIVAQLSESMKNQHNQIQAFVADLKSLVGVGVVASASKTAGPVETVVGDESSAEVIQAQTKAIMDIVKKQDEAIEQDMKDIKKLLATSRASDVEGNIIYVGPEVEQLLEKTESNLEWKIKMNGLWTVTFIYGAFAITLPILYALFKSS